MTLDRNTDGTLLQTRIDAGTGMLVRVFHFIVKMLSEPHNTFITIRLLVPNHYTARYFYLPVLHLDRNTSHRQVTDNK